MYPAALLSCALSAYMQWHGSCVVHRHSGGGLALQSDFDFGDLFTQAARVVVPRAHAKGLSFLFDYRGPALRCQADPSRMREALCRVLLAAVDVLEEGYVFFTAQVSVLPAAACQVAVAAASSGRFARAAVWREVLARLQIPSGEQMNDQALLECDSKAVGVCPITGGRVAVVRDMKEGSMFSLDLGLMKEQAYFDVGDVEPDAAGARAWLIRAADAETRSLERRLQRLGWATRVFDQLEAARHELESMPLSYSRPRLVLAYHDETVTASTLGPLATLLPQGAQVVLAMSPDVGVLHRGAEHDGVETRLYPFSPSDLREFTERAGGGGQPSDETRPAPLAFVHRRRALVVDDNAVNQMVASGMLQVLGFEVDTACDGQEAIEHCMKTPPDLVLMDLHMPGMDGLEAARRLRMLQQEGALPCFPILAATADTTSQEACESAGMDGHLPKPLNLSGLEHHLRRLIPG